MSQRQISVLLMFCFQNESEKITTDFSLAFKAVQVYRAAEKIYQIVL